MVDGIMINTGICNGAVLPFCGDCKHGLFEFYNCVGLSFSPINEIVFFKWFVRTVG